MWVSRGLWISRARHLGSQSCKGVSSETIWRQVTDVASAQATARIADRDLASVGASAPFSLRDVVDVGAAAPYPIKDVADA